MRALSLPGLHRLTPLAPLVLRLIVGVVMVAHGLQKLTGGPAAFGEGAIAALELPAPALLGWLVTLVELLGGIGLLLGLFTRVAALGIAALMVGTTVLVKRDAGLIGAEGAGAELDLLILAGAVALALTGPGQPSVDHVIGVEGTTPTPAPAGRRPVRAR